MKKLGIGIFISAFMAACATGPKVMEDVYLKNVNDIAYLEVSLSHATRHFKEDLYLRGEVTCNTSFTKVLNKTKEAKPLLVATRGGSDEPFIKAKVPANKPVALKLIKHKVTDEYHTDFVVLLEPNKTYRITNYKKLEVVEKDTKKSAIFLPNNHYHSLLKCDKNK